MWLRGWDDGRISSFILVLPPKGVVESHTQLQQQQQSGLFHSGVILQGDSRMRNFSWKELSAPEKLVKIPHLFLPLLYLRTDLKPNAKVRVEDLTPKYFPRGPCIERNFLEACFFCCHRHLSQPSYSCCTFSLRQCWHVLYSQSHFQMLILLVSHKKLSHFQRSLIVVVCHSSHSSRRRWKLCTRKRRKHKVE